MYGSCFGDPRSPDAVRVDDVDPFLIKVSQARRFAGADITFLLLLHLKI